MMGWFRRKSPSPTDEETSALEDARAELTEAAAKVRKQIEERDLLRALLKGSSGD